jgi:hypothetical protein
MKVIKLDKRYAGFPKWKYALDFGKHKYGKLPRQKYAVGFKKLFGPDRWANPDTTVSVFSREWYLYNENWANDVERGRILYNNESDLSAVLLMLDR